MHPSCFSSLQLGGSQLKCDAIHSFEFQETYRNTDRKYFKLEQTDGRVRFQTWNLDDLDAFQGYSYFSFPRVLVSRQPLWHPIGPSPTSSVLLPSLYRFPLLVALPPLFFFFDTFCTSAFNRWTKEGTHTHSHTHKKTDRWRDETKRSRRQMEEEREDGRRRKKQSLLFLAAGRSYFRSLYNRYTFYIMINPTLNPGCMFDPRPLLPASCLVILLFRCVDRRAGAAAA